MAAGAGVGVQCARITREPRGNNKDTANASYGKDISDIGVQRWASKHIYPTVIRQHLNMAAAMAVARRWRPRLRMAELRRLRLRMLWVAAVVYGGMRGS